MIPVVVLNTCADDYIRYAHGLIADYLPVDLGKQLFTSLGFVCLSVSVCLSVYLQISAYVNCRYDNALRCKLENVAKKKICDRSY